MEKLYGLEPKKVFKYFEEISQIPRGSGNEKAISDYMVKFAKERNLYVVQDSVNNILIKKEGTVGYENSIDVYKWQDGKETKIEKINGTYHSNYINNFNCEINNGYIKEIDTKKVRDSAVIALNGGKVDDIIYGSANNTDIIFDNYNNKVNSLKYNTPNNLNITIKSGLAEIEFLRDKFHLVVEDEGKIIINGKTYLKGIYEIDSVVDGFAD